MKAKEKISAFSPQERILLFLGALFFVSLIILLTTLLHIHEATKDFQQRASDVYFKTNQRIGTIEAVLASLAGLHRAKESLNSTELITFTQELLLSYPHFDVVFYLPLIPVGETGEYEQSMQDSGFPEFRIRDSLNRQISEKTNRKTYLPVGFIEPLDPDSAELLGIDLLTDARLKPIVQQAFLNGGTVFSGTVKLIEGKPRIYGFRAVYEGYFIPDTQDERLNQAQGLFAVEIDPKLFFADVFKQIPGMGVKITLSTSEDTESSQILFTSRPVKDPGPLRSVLPSFNYEARLGQTNHQLKLDLFSTITAKELRPTEVAFVLLITLFLAGAVIQVLRSQRIAGIKDRRAQDLIFSQRARAEATLHAIGEAVITTDIYGVIEYMNPMAEELTGWIQEKAIGKNLTEIFDLIDERSGRMLPSPIGRCLANSTSDSEARALMVRTDGKAIAVDDTTALVKDRSGKVTGVVLVIRDISLEELTQQMTFLANHDPLTQLANRRAFERSLNQAVENATQKNNTYTLCYIDLDHFKIINDSCGHMAGDRLLTQVTARLKSHVRRSDLLARLGGDEFALLLHNCPLPRAKEIAEAIRKDIKEQKLHWENRVFSVTTSIGIVAIDGNIGSTDEILNTADNACYTAKERGRNRIHIYHSNDKTLANKQGESRWIEKIQEGLHHSSFTLFLQSMRPLDPVQNDAEMHEFLLRLPSEHGSFISPSTIIHSAERYNKMFDIDCWVIHHAFHIVRLHFQAHPEKKTNNIFSINISGQSLDHPDLVPYIRQELEKGGLSPNNICFEITETSMVANLDHALTLMNELKSLGYHMALDDFGTGLSSFTYLKKLPFDFLKIDGSFVRDVANDPVDRAMVDTINHIGEVLKMRTIAEWVEDKTTLSILGDIGVNFAQGFFIGKPAPAHPSQSPWLKYP